MTEIAKAKNQGDDDKLASIIVDNDLSEKGQATIMAISAFQITKENVTKFHEAAMKLAELPEPCTFRESIRHWILKEIVAKI
jgi:hypothetical protein